MKILQSPKFEVWSDDIKLKEYDTELKSFSMKQAGWDYVSLAIFQSIDSRRQGRIIRIGLQPTLLGSISCEMREDFCEIRIDGEEIVEGVMSLLGLPDDSNEGAKSGKC